MWGRRFVVVLSLDSLPSAGCNSFSLPSPEGPVHQYRPWHCHLPVQRGLDWGWQGLCAHRQLHAGEQRELPPQRWLCLHWAWTGTSQAKHPAGGITTPSGALRLPWIARGKNWAGQQPITVHLNVRCTGVFRTAAPLWGSCSKGTEPHSVIQFDPRHQLLHPPVPRAQHWRACDCSDSLWKELGQEQGVER